MVWIGRYPVRRHIVLLALWTAVWFVVTGLFSPFPADVGEKLADAFMSGLGLYMLILVGRAAADHNRGTGLNHHHLQQRVLIAGAAFVPHAGGGLGPLRAERTQGGGGRSTAPR
ncbi:hypothetical protein [Streptomyces sp. NPDC003395]